MYLIIIAVAMVLITLLNWLALGWSLLDAMIWMFAATGIEIGIIVVLAILAGLCTPRKFYHESKVYAVGKREMSFYRAIRLNIWKDYVAELGFFGGFSKKKLAVPNDPAYIDRFIFELNKGMFVHYVGTIGSFFVLLFPLPGFWSITFPVALVGAILNILPIMVLRFNKPRLLLLKKRLLRNQTQNQLSDEKEVVVKEPKKDENS